jgi:hypothetical protein
LFIFALFVLNLIQISKYFNLSNELHAKNSNTLLHWITVRTKTSNANNYVIRFLFQVISSGEFYLIQIGLWFHMGINRNYHLASRILPKLLYLGCAMEKTARWNFWKLWQIMFLAIDIKWCKFANRIVISHGNQQEWYKSITLSSIRRKCRQTK